MSIPLPALTSVPLPPIEPLNVLLALLPPTTSVTGPSLGSLSVRALLPESPPTSKVPTPGLNCNPLSVLMLTVLFWTAAALANCRVPWLIDVPPE